MRSVSPKATIGWTLAALAGAAGVLALPGCLAQGADDAVALAELGDDPPFRIALGGPLWHDRTLRDEDAQDFALVTDDEPLEVEVRGSAKVRVAQVQLRVDGHRQRLVAPSCDQGRCPSKLRLTLTPRLRRLQPGDHRIEVAAHDPHGAVSVQGFDVRTVARVPAVAEADPVGKPRPPPAAPRGNPRLERAALRVLAAERRRGALAGALGAARVTVVQVGPLNAGGRRLGATMLVDLVRPRGNLWATVPDYVPADGGSGQPPYTRQRVRMHVAALRDALIDIDLDRRRVIAFEPGPRSRSLVWSPSQAPAPAGAGDED